MPKNEIQVLRTSQKPVNPHKSVESLLHAQDGWKGSHGTGNYLPAWAKNQWDICLKRTPRASPKSFKVQWHLLGRVLQEDPGLLAMASKGQNPVISKLRVARGSGRWGNLNSHPMRQNL